MNTIKKFIKNEISGWALWEVLWLFTTCGIIAGISIYWQCSLMAIISAVTGTVCVILTGKGKLSAYIFGLINCVLYAIISYKAKLFGEVSLNVLYYLPMQFYGFHIWKKHMSVKTKEVEKKRMTWRKRMILAMSIVSATYLYGLILTELGDAMPFVDAFTTVSSIIALIVSIKMFAEQWWIWVCVNVFSIWMWYNNYQVGNDNIATILMWSIYLINSVIMLVKWEREAKNKYAI